MSVPTFIVGSIDGDMTLTMDQLRAGVGTDWNDESYISVWDAGGKQVGIIDPHTGMFHEFPEGSDTVVI